MSAVQLHVRYYAELTKQKSTQPTIRKLLKDKYGHLLVTPGQEDREAVRRRADELDDVGEFDPDDEQDARRWVLTSIASRQGQPKFRKRLLAAYDGRCAISGCGVEDLLEAAHIRRYKGPQTNHSTNGLLLRTDLHTLFDLRLIAIDSAAMTVLIASGLKGTEYADLAGKKLTPPGDDAKRPNAVALDKHREESGL
ncbi:MAG: HNH endonuclease [Gemmataceae bacterium]|nr:HNH endonuclease [Gemmataceae bacterium]